MPYDTVERCKEGSPIEKIKMEKDGTAAFVDIYEYARKIREGEMTWEEVEKADLDTVRFIPCFYCNFARSCPKTLSTNYSIRSNQLVRKLLLSLKAFEMGWYAP